MKVCVVGAGRSAVIWARNWRAPAPMSAWSRAAPIWRRCGEHGVRVMPIDGEIRRASPAARDDPANSVRRTTS